MPAGEHTLTATFTPTDANYAVTNKTALFNVWKRTPVVTWNITSASFYGTPLSGAQLNATADAPGTFTYSPPAGTILNAGTHTLSVTFTERAGELQPAWPGYREPRGAPRAASDHLAHT